MATKAGEKKLPLNTKTITREIAESPCHGSIIVGGREEEFDYVIDVYEPSELVEGKRVFVKTEASGEMKTKPRSAAFGVKRPRRATHGA